MNRSALLNQIIELEWEMFSSVANVGGPASCQNDPRTFQIMRQSQAQTWSTALLQSVLNDLETANRDEINLMTLKYARMMEYTHPDEYESIKDMLPSVDEETLRRIDDILAIHLHWEEELSQRYPRLRVRGRPSTREGDNRFSTSLETYMRGELSTFSPRSIEIYHQDTMQARDAGMNLAEKILLNTVQAYGYSSLEDAEG